MNRRPGKTGQCEIHTSNTLNYTIDCLCDPKRPFSDLT